jgi:transcriptional regulator with XRE-family HTH domain
MPRNNSVPDPILVAIGRALAGLRAEAGLSQAEAASRLGVSPPAVAAWEAGRRTPALKDVPRLAESYGVLPWDAAQRIFEAIRAAG